MLIAVSSRLSARSQERRISALRLVGLSGRRARRVLTVETGAVALTGSIVGAVVWTIVRPASEQVGLGPLRWWADDVSLSPLTFIAVAASVVALSVAASLFGANPAVEQPFRSRRNAAAPAPRTWKAASLVLGSALLIVAAVTASSFEDNQWLVLFLAGNFLTAVGLMLAVPHLARLCAWALRSLKPTPARLLAARRLSFEPTAIGRVIAECWS